MERFDERLVVNEDSGNKFYQVIPCEDGKFVLYADAQATIAALEQRVKELKQWVQDQSTANLETMRHMDEMQSRAMDAESQLTQRTAELEAANQQVMDERNLSNSWMKKHDELLAKVHKSGQFGAVVVQDVLKERDTLQAELERVRADNKALDKWRADVTVALQRPEGAFFVDVPQHIKDLVKERDSLRTLIAALPKVEREIYEAVASYRYDKAPEAWFHCENQLIALLKHRQGMEG